MARKKFGDLMLVSLLDLKKKYCGEILYAELQIIEKPISGSANAVFDFSAKIVLAKPIFASAVDISVDINIEDPYQLGPDEYNIVSCQASGEIISDGFVDNRPAENLYFKNGILFKHTIGYTGIIEDYFVHYKHREYAVHVCSAELRTELKGIAHANLFDNYNPISVSAQHNLIFDTEAKCALNRNQALALENGTLFNHLPGTNKIIPYYDAHITCHVIYSVKAQSDISLETENTSLLTKTYYTRWVPVAANGSSGINVRQCQAILFYDTPAFPLITEEGLLFNHLSGIRPGVYLDSGVIYEPIIHRLPKHVLSLGKASGEATFYAKAEIDVIRPKALIPCTAFGDAVSSGLAVATTKGYIVYTSKIDLNLAPNFTANIYRILPRTECQVDLGFVLEVSSEWGVVLPTTASADLISDIRALIYRTKILSASADFLLNALGEGLIFKPSLVWARFSFNARAHSRSFYRVTASSNIKFKTLADISSIEGIASNFNITSSTEATGYRCRILSANGGANFEKDHVRYTAIYCHIAQANVHIDLEGLADFRAIYKGIAECVGELEGFVSDTWTYRISTMLDLLFGYRAFQPPINTVRGISRGESYFDPVVLRSELKFFLYAQGLYNRLYWNRYRNVSKYLVYMSSEPGGFYTKIGEAPALEKPFYDVQIDMAPRNLRIETSSTGVKLKWDEPLFKGVPATFKIIPEFESIPVESAEPDIIWIDDELPEGATWVNQNGLSVSSYCRHGNQSFKITAENGTVEPKFVNAPEISGHIIVWVYIENELIPDAFWLTLVDNEGNERRLFWAQNKFKNSVLGEKEKRYCEELPVPDTWAPLIFHTDDLELSNVTGVGIGVTKETGNAALYIDSICYTPQPVYKIPFPHVPLRRERRYSIYRDDKFIGYSDSLEYNDNRVFDSNIGSDVFDYKPVYSIRHNEYDDTIRINWTVPLSEGTEYTYKVISHDSLGGISSAATLTTTIAVEHLKTKIIIKSENTPEYFVTVTENSFVQENIVYGDTYEYTFISYDVYDNPTSIVYKTYTVPYSSRLGSFVLGESPLA